MSTCAKYWLLACVLCESCSAIHFDRPYAYPPGGKILFNADRSFVIVPHLGMQVHGEWIKKGKTVYLTSEYRSNTLSSTLFTKTDNNSPADSITVINTNGEFVPFTHVLIYKNDEIVDSQYLVTRKVVPIKNVRAPYCIKVFYENQRHFVSECLMVTSPGSHIVTLNSPNPRDYLYLESTPYLPKK